MESVLVTAIAALVLALAGGALINRYWPLMGFKATATLCVVLAASFVLPFLYNDEILVALAPYLKGGASMWWFRGGVAAAGLALSIAFLFIFERNYWKLEERLKSKSPAVVVQAPVGPTVDQIAEAVEKRLGSQQASSPVLTTPPIAISKPPAPEPSLDQRATEKAVALLPQLTKLTGEGERLYLNMIGDPHQVENFPKHQREIEQWRGRVGQTYDRELPDSGARALVLPHDGTLRIGPIGFELSRLVKAIEGQRTVIQDLEKYAKRSLTKQAP